MHGIPREKFSKKDPLGPHGTVCSANVSLQDQNNNQQQFATLPGVHAGKAYQKAQISFSLSKSLFHITVHY